MSPVVIIGNLSVGLALGLSLFGIFLFYAARRLESENAGWWARASLYANFFLMTVANLAMVYALLHDDFSVGYVAHVGSRETPRWVSAISLWSSLEGSLLLWGWVLSAFSAACLYRNRETHLPLISWVGLILLIVQLFFYLLLALPANPFLPVNPPPLNGPGPNPLLQNHWLMAVHPPCLYIGYIGFTIPFAFAIAALIESRPTVREIPPGPPLSKRGWGDFSATWILLSRRWTLLAWSFLSVAIMLGGWWSYAVLGWGGYWAWDPVENASFMPWLTGTALVHSVMVQEKRKMLPVWNLALAILTFLLTLLGTFLTRSGILDSVHSFTESHIGPYFLVFIGIVLVGSLAVLFWRGEKIQAEGRFDSLLSLEFLLLFNNLLFLSFCFIVFLGTFYPLLLEAITGKRISIGEPYFNQMSAPITSLLLLLMGIGLLVPWKRGDPKILFRQSVVPLVLSLVVGLISFLFGGRAPWVLAIVLLASYAFFVMGAEVFRLAPKRNFFQLLLDNPRRYGGFIAHTGALLIVVAVALSSTYEKDQEVTLKRGESVKVSSYLLSLDRLTGEQTPQRFEVKAHLQISRGEAMIGKLTPQMNYYPGSREPIGSPAVRSTWKEDLYTTLIQVDPNGENASFRVILTPAVVWVWVGGLMVMSGGLLAMLFRRTAERRL